MDISFSPAKNILANNQLVRGRIGLTSVEIQRLYRSIMRQKKKLQKQVIYQKNDVKSSLDQIKILKSELKYCEETLQKAFCPSTENISLIYKKINNHYYVKARFYWQGQQREVQVGSIPIILDIIQQMLNQGYLQDISVPKSNHMTWEQFKKKDQIIEATKEIAAIKFQEYIIRKIVEEDRNQFEKGNLEKRNSDNLAKTSQIEKNEVENPEKEKFEWYVKWREDNLK